MRAATVWDLETTGLGRSDRIIEVGFCHVDLDTGEVIFIESVTVNPGIPIPRGSIRVHQITDEDVRNAPPLEHMWGFIRYHLSGDALRDRGYDQAAVVTHNGREFDEPFLMRELDRIGDRFTFTAPHVDTIHAVWGIHPGQPRALGKVYARFTGKKIFKAHSAADDSKAGAEVLVEMIRVTGGLDALIDIEQRAYRSIELYNRSLIDTPDGMLWLGKPHALTPIADLPRKVLASALKKGKLTPAARSVVREELARRDGGVQQKIDTGGASGVRHALFELSILQVCAELGLDPINDVRWSEVFGTLCRTGLDVSGAKVRWSPTAMRGRHPVGSITIEQSGKVRTVTETRQREIVEEVKGCAW